MLKHKLKADTGNGDPPPKKPPVQDPMQEPVEPVGPTEVPVDPK